MQFAYEDHKRLNGVLPSPEQQKQIRKRIMREVCPDDHVRRYRDKVNLLENQLKNIVIRKIVKIRESKSGQTIIQAV